MVNTFNNNMILKTSNLQIPAPSKDNLSKNSTIAYLRNIYPKHEHLREALNFAWFSDSYKHFSTNVKLHTGVATFSVRSNTEHNFSFDLHLADDRDFDAFVSYASSDLDRKFVLEVLVPRLEESLSFTLCLHQRDFMAGQCTYSQMLRDY